MLKKYFVLILFVLTSLLILGCGGNTGPGSFLGIPAFILDPIYYANTEINGDQIDLGIRKIYAVVYTDSNATPIDNSLWVFFVNKKTNLDDIANGDCAPFVVLKVNDIDDVTEGQHYSIKQTLHTSNFMVWMDVNDDKDVFLGDTIELDIDAISLSEGSKVKGEFTSTLHRGNTIALAEKFKFDAPINLLNATPLSL